METKPLNNSPDNSIFNRYINSYIFQVNHRSLATRSVSGSEPEGDESDDESEGVRNVSMPMRWEDVYMSDEDEEGILDMRGSTCSLFFVSREWVAGRAGCSGSRCGGSRCGSQSNSINR